MNEIIFNRMRELTHLDTKTLSERALKTCEEAGELAGATLSFTKASGVAYKGLGQDDVIEEAMDVIICAYAMAIHAKPDITMEQIEAIITKKMNKWEQKVKEQKNNE